MKTRVICALLSVVILMLLAGCGGDGGSGSGTGTVSMDITDAKPLVAGDPSELWVTIEEVLVHSSGGGWVSLGLPYTPLEINLLAFTNGQKTELATPTEVPSGHITQIRFVISEAYMVDGNQEQTPIDLDVPSGILRTDKQFDWWLEDGGAVHITVHFDMSQSVVQTGGGEYKLKPVIHLFEGPDTAATICGSIGSDCFAEAEGPVVITVKRNTDDQEPYTRVTVTQEDNNSTDFCIFWLVPGEAYIFELDTDGNLETAEYKENASVEDLESDIFNLDLMCPQEPEP